jgi:Tol biopolymer transport system component
LRSDATSGDSSLAVANETCSGVPYFSSDGQSFFCYRDEPSQIVQVDVTSGKVLRTFATDGQGAGISPDSRHIVYGDGGTRALGLLVLATGETRDIIRQSPPSTRIGNFGTLGWTPDSRSVVFYGRMAGDEGMWLVPIDGGAPHKINVGVGPILSWRFNAKTGQVAFATDGAGGRLETWKMENFLPLRPRN